MPSALVHVSLVVWSLGAIAAIAYLAPSWWLPAAFTLAAIACAWLLFRASRRAPPITTEIADESLGDTSSRAIVSQVLPAWNEQVGSARAEGNQAVESLVAAFQDLAAKTAAQLQDAQQAVEELTSSEGALPALRATRTDLDSVLEAMRRVEQVKESILAEAMRAGDLTGLAGEVRQFALQTRLLAMNASIEAARAGELGLGFGVVVREMRDLAERSASTSDRITRQVAVLTDAVAAIRQQDKGRATGAQPVELAEAAIDTVVRRVDTVAASLVDTAQRMERRAGQIRGGVADSLVALQFQDRVSQILDHTAASMRSLGEAFARRSWAAESWDERLAGFARHPEGFSTLEVAPRTKGGGDITYF